VSSRLETGVVRELVGDGAVAKQDALLLRVSSIVCVFVVVSGVVSGVCGGRVWCVCVCWCVLVCVCWFVLVLCVVYVVVCCVCFLVAEVV